MQTWEIAAEDTHGGFELIGSFLTREASIAAAECYAESLYHDDNDCVILGLSSDPNSGHYEERVGMFRKADGSHETIDPMP